MAVTFKKDHPAYYINAQLKALKPGIVYSTPGGVAVRKNYDTGAIVGEIYSYVTRPDGTQNRVWWQLKEGGFVLHEKDKFDVTTAVNTSQGKQDEILDIALNNTEDLPLPSLGQLLGIGSGLLLFGGVIFIAYLYVISKK
jgi:hypothetical protein